MKKTIIISAIALCFSVVSVSAKPISTNFNNSSIHYDFKVNSFCVSIAKGDFQTVKKLIKLGEDVNRKSNGMTPAMYAAKFNRTKILKLLISKGAKLKIKSDKKLTALNYAKLHGAKEAAIIIDKALSKKNK